MQKKLVLACAAITAFAAFVIAPAASATTLTEEGKPLAPGSSITGTNTGATKFTAAFTSTPFILECEGGHLQGLVTQNKTGIPVRGEIPIGSITFTGFTGPGGEACSSAYKVTSKLCWEATSADTIKITGCATTVVIDVSISGLPCKYETASMIGTFTTNTTPATFSVSEQLLKTSSALCPVESRWDMAFDLYTTGGTSGLTFS